MRVVADSHAILWHLQGSAQLSAAAASALIEAEATDGVVVSISGLGDHGPAWHTEEAMATNAMHVTLAGDRAGDYLIEQELPDGRLVLRPDATYPTVVPSFGGRAATIEEFKDILGALPTDGEG